MSSTTQHHVGVSSTPKHRACSWCASEFVIVCRPGRPRLYCTQACRQRAYEHRHGFVRERTVRPLPGQAAGDVWGGTGYERGGFALLGKKAHAMRTSVRPEGRRRETLCGLLVAPIAGRYFSPLHPHACATCSSVAERSPLQHGVSPSNELSRLRAVIDEVVERRVDAPAALAWLHANAPVGYDEVAVGGGGGKGGRGGGRVPVGATTGTKTRSR